MLALLILALVPSLLYCIPFDTIPKVAACDKKMGQIAVNAHYFTGADATDYFGIDVIRLGYRPLVLEITNNAEEAYFLEPDSIQEWIVVRPQRVYEFLKFNLWSYVSLMAFSVYSRAPALVPITIMIPAYMLHRYNLRLWENIQRTVLDPRKPLRIDPGRTVVKIIFCREASLSSLVAVEFCNEEMTRTICVTVDMLSEIRRDTGNPILPALMVTS